MFLFLAFCNKTASRKSGILNKNFSSEILLTARLQERDQPCFQFLQEHIEGIKLNFCWQSFW